MTDTNVIIGQISKREKNADIAILHIAPLYVLLNHNAFKDGMLRTTNHEIE